MLLVERSKNMKYSIINKEEINIIGVECNAIQWDADGAIGRLWSNFLDKVDAIGSPVVPNVMYGLCEHETCSKDNTFTYLAGIEVEKGCQLPKGMVSRVVSPQKYLLVEVPEEIKTPDAYTRAFEYIKENGFEVDNNDEIEVYEEIFKDPDNNSFKLLLPIK
jgi:predicted transcriptional regulator YdeE